MAKPVVGKSVRSDWFFLGRDFAVMKRSKRCIFLVAKAADSNVATKTAKKYVNIVILHGENTSETTRKILKFHRHFKDG